MTKVVLDTNVLISGSLWRGVSFTIMEMIDEGILQLVLTDEILQEYLEVIENEEKREKTTEEQRSRGLLAVQKLLLNSTLVEPTEMVEEVKDDPDDNKILEAALAGNADYVITQDNHLLKLKKHRQAEIIRPSEFLEKISRPKGHPTN